MVNTARLSLAVLFVAWTAGAVHADLTPTVLPTPAMSDSVGLPQVADADGPGGGPSADFGANLGSHQFDVVGALGGVFGTGVSDGLVRSDESVARRIDPLPSSLSLFFSAMLSVGGWHLARSARHVRLGTLPGWYHTDAPAQIGHTLSFDFNYAPTVLRVFESATCGVDQQAAWRDPWGERCLRCTSQTFLLVAEPRGPPSVS